MCPDHKEEVTHYCKTCQRLVCQLCRVRRTHSGHKITPVLSAYQALKVKTPPWAPVLTHSHLLLTPGFHRAGRDAHLFLPPQDKLTKSLTYILGNQDTVQTQICELEETVRHTEVREGMAVALGPTWAWKQQGGVNGMAQSAGCTLRKPVWGPWMCWGFG